MKIIKRFPVTVLGLFGLTLLILVDIFHIGYDSSGLTGYIYWVAIIFSQPFMIVQELLFSFSAGVSQKWHWPILVLSQISICYAIDLFICRIRRKYFKKNDKKVKG